MLFKNEFHLFQFHFKPKISHSKRFPTNSSKIRPKISPPKKTGQKSLSQHKVMRKLHCDEQKGLLMQFHSINIKKPPTE